MSTLYTEHDVTWLREELAKDRPSPDCQIVFERVVMELVRLRGLVNKQTGNSCTECAKEGEPAPGVHCDTCGKANTGETSA